MGLIHIAVSNIINTNSDRVLCFHENVQEQPLVMKCT